MHDASVAHGARCGHAGCPRLRARRRHGPPAARCNAPPLSLSLARACPVFVAVDAVLAEDASPSAGRPQRRLRSPYSPRHRVPTSDARAVRPPSRPPRSVDRVTSPLSHWRRSPRRITADSARPPAGRTVQLLVRPLLLPPRLRAPQHRSSQLSRWLRSRTGTRPRAPRLPAPRRTCGTLLHLLPSALAEAFRRALQIAHGCARRSIIGFRIVGSEKRREPSKHYVYRCIVRYTQRPAAARCAAYRLAGARMRVTRAVALLLTRRPHPRRRAVRDQRGRRVCHLPALQRFLELQ